MIYFETDRLILRDYIKDDLNEYCRLKMDSKTMYYLQDIQLHSMEEGRKDFETVLSDIDSEKRQFYFLHMELKDTHEQVGSIGYTVIDDTPIVISLIEDGMEKKKVGAMKKYKKRIMVIFSVVALMTATFMTGCTKLSDENHDTSAEMITSAESIGASEYEPTEENNTSTEIDTTDVSDSLGVYVKLEREDVSTIVLQGGSCTKVCENADGSLLATSEWIFTGDDIAKLSEKENRSVLFTILAKDVDNNLLGEGTFHYDVTQGKMYVTISADGVTCSTSGEPDAPADVPSVLTLPILDEINETVTVGTAGSYMLAMQAAVKLMDWGMNTGLGADEIGEAASTWLAEKNNELNDCLKKLELVDDAYQKLLTDEARELLDSIGCEDMEITWGSTPLEPVEAIMRTAGLR